MTKLYDFELSDACYKARLALAFLGVPYQSVPVDFYPGREHESDAFLKLSPRGRLPVLDDDGFILSDAHAILLYVALKYSQDGHWLPRGDAQLMGEIGQWLSFAAALDSTASAARLHDAFFHDVDVDAARAGAHRLFRVLDEHLWFREQDSLGWLCSLDKPTIADIACFPSVVLSEEGGVSRQEYPAIRRWCDRFKRIPGFVLMSGVFPASRAAAA